MKQWELIDSTPVPGSDGFMRLMRQGNELVIRVDGRQLMSTSMHGSEDALADLACDHLKKRKEKELCARILIGGMGIGFTLAAALRRVNSQSEVVVAELVPSVVRWNRGILGKTAGHPIDDPRTSVYIGDVADLIRNPPHPWDAILLDVDNGPIGLTRSNNNWLYSWEGLNAAFDALQPGGVLGVWAATIDNAFTRLVKRVGFNVKPIPVRSRGAKGGMRHIIWVCIKET